MKKEVFIFVMMLIVKCSYAQDAVDLGLSVKWGNMNIGASDPFEPGEIFAWGEVEPKDSKDNCTWEKYFDTKQISKRYSSYSVSFNIFHDRGGYSSIKGHRSYDVAKKRLGGNWRMPTLEEFKEVLNSCTIQMLFNKEKDIYYFKVIGPNSNSIIIPLTRTYGYSQERHRGCVLWSTTMDSYGSDMDAYVAEFDRGYSSIMSIQKLWRCYGAAIRPVYDYLNDSDNSGDVAAKKWKEALKYVKAYNESSENPLTKLSYLEKADSILEEIEKMPNLKSERLDKVRALRKQIKSAMEEYEDV